MTFRDFCEAIGDGVLSCVPAARYQPPRELGDAATISLGGAKATISREKSGWRVAFVRSGGVTSMAPLAGRTVDTATAENLAGSIAGFLI